MGPLPRIYCIVSFISFLMIKSRTNIECKHFSAAKQSACTALISVRLSVISDRTSDHIHISWMYAWHLYLRYNYSAIQISFLAMALHSYIQPSLHPTILHFLVKEDWLLLRTVKVCECLCEAFVRTERLHLPDIQPCPTQGCLWPNLLKSYSHQLSWRLET